METSIEVSRQASESPTRKAGDAPVGQVVGFSHPILRLQQTLGNRRVAALMRSGQLSARGTFVRSSNTAKPSASAAVRAKRVENSGGEELIERNEQPKESGKSTTTGTDSSVDNRSSRAVSAGLSLADSAPKVVQRQPETNPGTTDGGAPVAVAPPPAKAAPDAPGTGEGSRASPAPASDGQSSMAGTGPTMSQGRIGDLVVKLPDWPLFGEKAIPKAWSTELKDTNLLTIPIPELAVGLGLSASASASASFVASLGPGALRNIRLGLTRTQALVLAGLPFFGGLEGMELAALLPTLHVLGFGDLRALADLEVPASVSLDFSADGTLKAAASVANLFDVATLAASLSATAHAGMPLKLGGPVGLYIEDGKMDFRYHQSLESQLNLAFSLIASIKATLLGFSWSKSWNLVQKSLGLNWTLGTVSNIGYDGGPKADLAMNERDNAGVLPGWLTDVLNAAASNQQLQSLLQLGGTPPPVGGGVPNTASGAASPDGRSESKPIDMIWFKSPGLYPPAIELGSDRYFLTQPNYVVVPDQPGLADIRRAADSSGRIKIGVSPGSKFYPQVGRVWPRVRVGNVRGGVKQSQFRRLLRALGYAWGPNEADHVRDLQWRGEDAYENLWPLDEARNNAANQVLDQLVTYRDHAGQVVTVPLSQTPLNLYFRIIGYNGSAASAAHPGSNGLGGAGPATGGPGGTHGPGGQPPPGGPK